MEAELLASLLSDGAAVLILSLCVGLVVGLFSGLLGIGGGTVLVPTFKLGFAMDAIASTATSLFTIIPTSLSGLITHVRRGTCIPKLGVAAGIAGAVTSPFGVWLAARSHEWMIMAVAAIVIGYTSITMLYKAYRMPKSGGKRAAASSDNGGASGDGPMFAAFKAGVTASMVAKAAAIGLIAGVMSGYVGVGGGFIMVPLFIKLLDMPMKLTSGTSLVAVLILAVPGVLYQGWLGNVDWLAGIAVALGTIPGASLGAHLIPRVPERMLRVMFGIFLLFAAVMLVLDQLGVMG